MHSQTIMSTITAKGGTWFAVLDGAQLEETSQRLSRSGLNYRCLYIGIEDNQNLKDTAPYLIRLNRSQSGGNADPFLVEKVIGFADSLEPLVFWQCNEGEEVLYMHLRGINKVDIPIQEEDGSLTDSFERVVFRHSDANVMAQVMPALNMRELSRCVGPADYVLFKPDDKWHEKIIHVEKGDYWPEAENGVFQISIPSYEKIIDNRGHGIITKIEIYLKEVLHNKKLTNKDFKKIASESFNEAKSYNIKTEGGFFRWSFLYAASNNYFGKNPDIANYMNNTSITISSDERIKALMEETANEIRKSGGNS